jgi:hypothetical protein
VPPEKGPLNPAHYRETLKARLRHQPVRLSDMETLRSEVPVVEIVMFCRDFV